MKKAKKPKTAKPAAENSAEAPHRHEQREVEMKLLATLVRVINSDQIDIKNDLLEMRATDFRFRDHRAIFEAIKKLADAGEVVDMAAVRVNVGDACLEALDYVFDGSGAYIGGAHAYKQKVLSRSPGHTKIKNG